MPAVEKTYRLVKVAKELNVGLNTIVDHLTAKGFDVDSKPTSKLTEEMHDVLLEEFQKDKTFKEIADKINLGISNRENIELSGDDVLIPKSKKDQEEILIKDTTAKSPLIESEETEKEAAEEAAASAKEEVDKKETEPVKKAAKAKPTKKEAEKEEEKKKKEKVPPADTEKDSTKKSEEPKEKKKAASPATEEPEVKIEKIKVEKLEGPKVVGKIDLPEKKEPKEGKKLVASSSEGFAKDKRRKKRKRLIRPTDTPGGAKSGDKKSAGKNVKAGPSQETISEKEIQEKIKETLSRLEGSKGKSLRSKHKKQKRIAAEETKEEGEEKNTVLQLTEFISVFELAKMMDISVSDLIKTCMDLGVIVSINQRLDAEIIELVTDEFDFKVKFIDIEDQEEIEIIETEDIPEKMEERPPIVTVMGHVDHGKTSLLDSIRDANVVAGESGGITQHIGAYEVTLESGKKITFLDTPGHEAFTAMRARGAKLTDIAIIVVAADDGIMPQTKEAISHAQMAGVPLIFAINKIDKDGANPEKIKEELASQNLLVEDWGGKYQSQDISAKSGENIENLLEKVLLEAEMLELKANPSKNATGITIEAALDKGRGYTANILVQEGTLHQGDFLLAGPYSGKVKAMFDQFGKKLKKCGPSTPVQILGLNGAPQPGEKIMMMPSEQEAKQLATKRSKIVREQGFRATKHITLDEIGRRLALGSFKELNLIIKADVDGSGEALSDSLLKLSTKEIQINVIHNSVGMISESDVLLASASDAIIIGFLVRPSIGARKLAEKESIDIRLYSVIYDATDEIKSSMEGMLEPKVEEKIVCNVEIKDVFKVSKVGTVAGCMVTDGKLSRNTKVHLIRDGIVVYTGKLTSLKRFKDDAKEVLSGMECGLTLEDFNDIKVADIIEGYEQVELKRTL